MRCKKFAFFICVYPCSSVVPSASRWRNLSDFSVVTAPPRVMLSCDEEVQVGCAPRRADFISARTVPDLRQGADLGRLRGQREHFAVGSTSVVRYVPRGSR